MHRFARPQQSITDLALLVGRLILGTVLIAHGWQKVTDLGLDAVAANFDKSGVPLPTVSAWFAAAVELGGGALLVLGLLTPVVGVLVALVMAGAFWFVHKGAGVFASDGGWELVAVIGAAALMLAGSGAGRFSLDHLLFGRRTVGNRRGVEAVERDTVGASTR